MILESPKRHKTQKSYTYTQRNIHSAFYERMLQSLVAFNLNIVWNVKMEIHSDGDHQLLFNWQFRKIHCTHLFNTLATVTGKSTTIACFCDNLWLYTAINCNIRHSQQTHIAVGPHSICAIAPKYNDWHFLRAMSSHRKGYLLRHNDVGHMHLKASWAIVDTWALRENRCVLIRNDCFNL